MAEMRSERDQRDLVLAPNEFAYIQDKTKGEINTHVGPTKATLSGDDIPMKFNADSKKFIEVPVSDIKQTLVTAPAGWYVNLWNPSKTHPRQGTKNTTPEDMIVGKRIAIPGPCSFALWPGQMSEVIQGHRLRSNQYLIIEVYDDEAARESWTKATVKTAAPYPEGSTHTGEGNDKVEKSDANATVVAKFLEKVPDDLANGKQYIVKGTEVAFYIPPSGVKVVKDEKGSYVREAVTLEKLEYSILLDESGDKQFEYGSKIVFPAPSQKFVMMDGQPKAKAIELDVRKGVYVKVIEAYEEGGRKYNVGDELFIMGEGVIYFPRKEHSIIKYGQQEIHYATAIPKGEGRYSLDRDKGDVKIIRGPVMYLPDPRKEVITRRVLTERDAKLIYPGNQEALDFNKTLASQNKETSPQALADYTAGLFGGHREESASKKRAVKERGTEEHLGGDFFERHSEYTQPRTIILDTKYQGVPAVNVWTGYAVKVVNKAGQGRVVVGPDAFLLEYDETLEPMQLSTGKPKTTDKMLETAYLLIKGNKVSDIIQHAVSADMVGVEVLLSYRVNFEGSDPLKWFSVENYVKFLCDHVRSVLISVVRKHKISDLHANSTEIIRDAILGKKAQGTGNRPGMMFEENNMRIYDVEVLDVAIANPEVSDLLVEAELGSITSALSIATRQQEVEAIKIIESLSREETSAKRETEFATHKANLAKISETLEATAATADGQRKAEKDSQGHQDQLAKTRFEAQQELKNKGLANDKNRLEIEKTMAAERLSMEVAKSEADEKHEQTMIQLVADMLKARSEHAKAMGEAFSPDLVQAINNLGNKQLLETLSSNFGDLSILEGKGIMATITRFLDVMPEGQGLIDSIRGMFSSAAPMATDKLTEGTDKQ